MSSTSAAALLGNRDFVRLWLVGGLTGTMRWLEVLAIGLHTFAVTGSALSVALMLFARTLPSVLLGAPMGTLAERVDRVRLLTAGTAGIAAVAGVLAALALAGRIELWHVAAGAFVSGTVWTMEHTVRRTLIGDAAQADIGTAMSLDAGTFNATRMIGPLLGGMLYASLGIAGAYLASTVIHGAAALCVATLRVRAPAPRTGREPFLRTLVEGLRYVRGHRLLCAVMVGTLVLNFFGFSYAAMVPVIGRAVLRLDAIAIGALQSMEGLGAVLGAIALTLLARPRYHARTFLAGGALFLSMVLAFALSARPLAAMGALLVAGPGLAAFGAMQSTVLLRACDPRMRSRAMGVLVVCIGAGPLGVLAVGMLADTLGPVTALALMSSTGLVALACAAWTWPELWRAPPPGMGS